MNYPAAIHFLNEAIAPIAVPKILVVEDDANDLILLLKQLKKFVCNVMVAKSGEEAKREIEEDGIDLVFLDLHLPQMAGMDVLQATKGLSSAMHWVVVTGYPDSETQSLAIKSGAMLALQKPVTEETLASILRRHEAK
jgi:DNA-binding NtrC family response regulator